MERIHLTLKGTPGDHAISSPKLDREAAEQQMQEIGKAIKGESSTLELPWVVVDHELVLFAQLRSVAATGASPRRR